MDSVTGADQAVQEAVAAGPPPGPARAHRTDRLRRVGARLRAWVVTAPATTGLLAFLLLHSVALVHLGPGGQAEVLRRHSTNLSQLAEHPVGALVDSALWIEMADLPMVALLALCVLAPAERRFGTFRTVVVFFLGHVLATLITAGVLTALLHTPSAHFPDRGFGSAIDVGVSYGGLCVAGVLTYAVPSRPVRLLTMAGLLAAVWVSGAFFEDYTAFGHNTAVVLGFLLHPVVAYSGRRDVSSRSRAGAPGPVKMRRRKAKA
ncbi:rhomboid-like protein [Streptomyces varsoviensis]|uniref:rhomboid-like protein n=1 Tax=Streptomyces varsoviensis TaxID=67373 RepID=UPI00066207CF|nr:rhomboid-like protein [Streptomyces varsoviensis]